MHRRKAKPDRIFILLATLQVSKTAIKRKLQRRLEIIELGTLVNARFTKLQKISCDPLPYVITCKFYPLIFNLY